MFPVFSPYCPFASFPFLLKESTSSKKVLQLPLVELKSRVKEAVSGKERFTSPLVVLIVKSPFGSLREIRMSPLTVPAFPQPVPLFTVISPLVVLKRKGAFKLSNRISLETVDTSIFSSAFPMRISPLVLDTELSPASCSRAISPLVVDNMTDLPAADSNSISPLVLDTDIFFASTVGKIISPLVVLMVNSL